MTHYKRYGSITRNKNAGPNAKPFRAQAYDPLLQKIVASKSFDTESKANVWLIKRELEIHADYRAAGVQTPVPVAKVVPSVVEYGFDWLDRQPYSLETLAAKRWHLRAFGKVHGDMRVDSVTVTECEEYLASAPSASSRVKFFHTLRRVLEAAKAEGYLEQHPMRTLANVAAPESYRPYVTQGMLDRLVAGMPEDYQLAVYLGYDAGLRIGEVCGLPVENIDLGRRQMLISQVIDRDNTVRESTKNKRAQWVPLSTRLCELLEPHVTDRVGLLFAGPEGGVLRPKTLGYYFAKARAGVSSKVTFHCLRHACARNLALQGEPAYVIQQILRHSSLNQAQRYLDEVSMERRLAAVG